MLIWNFTVGIQASGGGAPEFGALDVSQSAAITGALAVANGGTGGTTAATGRSGLGAAASGANSDITSIAGLTTALSVDQGGTGATTLTNNGMLYGTGTTAITATGAGSQYEVFQAGATGTPTVGPLNLAQSAATTGSLPVNRGGTGAATFSANNVLLGNGTSAFQVVAPGTSGNVLTSNGTTWSSAAPFSPWTVSGGDVYRSSGNVGIGTTAPSFKLTVEDGLTFNNSTTNGTAGYGLASNGGSWWWITSKAGAGNYLAIGGSGATPPDAGAINIINNNNVGIGSTWPGSKLDVVGTGMRLLSGGGYTALAIGRTGADAQLGVAGIAGNYSTSAAAGDIVLRTESTGQRLLLQTGTGTSTLALNNGNVGIGTTNPTSKLHVAGTAGTDGIKYPDGSLQTSAYALPPIGSIIAWHKSMAGVPALPTGWLECNGAVISDSGSPMNGQTLPNLNSATQNGTTSSGMFLRGAPTSGTLQADATAVNGMSATTNANRIIGGSTIDDASDTWTSTSATVTLSSSDPETRPANMTVVWIMRIK